VDPQGSPSGHNEVVKASCSPKSLPGNAGRDACNVLKSTLSPAMGRTCGRRERGTGAGGGEKKERSSDSSSCSRRNGGRHPDSQDAVSLRGLAEQCESWLVRHACKGLVPRQAHAPATTGVLWKNEEGNVVSVRQAPALIEVTPNKRCFERGHVLHSVQRPVHVNRHCNSHGASRGRWRGGSDIAVGQTHESGRNRHRGLGRRTNARLAARHRFFREGRA